MYVFSLGTTGTRDRDESPELLTDRKEEENNMKALKIMFNDGSIIAYRVLRHPARGTVSAMQMIEMSEDEFAKYDEHAKPDTQTLIQNSGHVTVRA